MSEDRSSYQQFIRLFLPISAVVFFSLLSTFEWQQFQESKAAVVKKLETLTSTYSLLLAEPVMQDDPQVINTYIVSLLSDNDITLIHITDFNDKLLHQFGDISTFDKKHQRTTTIKFADETGMQKAGILTLGVSLKRIEQESYDRVKLSVVLFLSVVVTVILVSHIAFVRIVGKPLQQIISAMKSFERDQQPRPIKTSSGKEINQVANAFNAMQERLAAQHSTLENTLLTKTEELDNELNEHIQTAEDLFEARYRSQVALDSILESIATTDQRGIVNYLNPAARQLITINEEDAYGTLITDVFNIHGDNNFFSEDSIYEILADRGSDREIQETWLTSHSGDKFIITARISQLLNSRDEIIGLSLLIRDITASTLIKDKLSHEASHDPLTGLLNRRAFESTIIEYLQDTKINNTQHAICYLDLDHFKKINDVCGHQAGDELLVNLTRELKTWLRSNDTIARIGGDEFAILLGNCSVVDAELLCNKIIKHIGEYVFEWEGQQFSVGGSIGIAPITADSGNTDELLRKADLSCYAAKKRGRNQVHIHS